MKSTTKQAAGGSDDALTRAVFDMLSKGETRRELAGYSVSLRLEVEPKFIDKTKEGSR